MAYATDFLNAYVTTALWSSVDDHGNPLDEAYGPDDIDHDTLHAMNVESFAFIQDNWTDLHTIDPSDAGQDFWLTRNRHGAGYWDRGYGDKGERLTRAAHAWGSVDLYVADDGLVHGF